MSEQNRTARRFSDALGIQEGACNPSGMAHSLVNACRECIAEGVTQRDDPAVRLIVHQIAYIVGVTNGVEPMARGPDYFDCTKACRDAVAKQQAAPVALTVTGPVLQV